LAFSLTAPPSLIKAPPSLIKKMTPKMAIGALPLAVYLVVASAALDTTKYLRSIILKEGATKISWKIDGHMIHFAQLQLGGWALDLLRPQRTYTALEGGGV